MSFRDPYPELSLFIDVGGDHYYLGADKSIDLTYGSRENFLKTFTNNAKNQQDKNRIEYLLRKYMYATKGDRKYSFDRTDEKQELIDLLKKRSNQLKHSKEFSSSLLKNAFFQRIVLNLQTIIHELEGASLRPTNSNDEKSLDFLKSIPEEKITQLILELSWYLLHPDKVPKDILQEWVLVIKKLDQLRVHDLVDRIHTIEKKNNLVPLGSPLNYFEKIHIGKVAKSNNALEDAIKMATSIEDQDLQKSLKERLKLLLDILQAKKYLNNSLPKNELGFTKIDSSTQQRLSKQIMTNPQHGGGRSLDRRLNVAMSPLFEYFHKIYDPVYGFIESSVKEFIESSVKGSDNMIPSLLTLLHICQHISPSESSQGVYRIDGTPPSLLSYINHLLTKTKSHIGVMRNDEEKNNFQEQIINLPKVRLTTLINPIANPQVFKDPDNFPYIQLFTIGGNMTIPEKESFLSSPDPKLTEQTYNLTTDFFLSDCLYLVITKGNQTREKIPLQTHTVDFAKVDIEDMIIPITVDHSFDNKEKGNQGNQENPLYLENLVELTPYVYCNDSEVALSILIAFQHLMSM